MSGIVGIYRIDDQPISNADLHRMLAKLEHRGPDGHNIWAKNKVGLGHCMLWTTPESLHEHLPTYYSGPSVSITADVRLDNRTELIKKLQLTEYPASEITDSQLILEAYCKWGDRCPDHLLGAFAFAIWDERKQRLFCARDHMGVKPFYYHYRHGHTFAFASEMKALLCLEDVSNTLDELRIGEFLAVTFDDKERTTYQDILRLPPAHTLSVTTTAFSIKQYWELDRDRELHLSSDDEYAEVFNELFTEAVRCRLRTDFSIGSQLSGGLDSSSVTCVARQILREQNKAPLHTFSCIFDDVPECDERSYIQAVLDQGDLTPHLFRADQIGPLSGIDDILNYEDEAFPGPNYFYPWHLCQTAKKEGIRVFLDGHDGDTVVSHGVDRLTELAQQKNWSTFTYETRALAEKLGTSATGMLHHYGLRILSESLCQGEWLTFVPTIQYLSQNFSFSRRQVLKRYGLKPLRAKVRQLLWQRPNDTSLAALELPKHINPDFADKLGLAQHLDAIKNDNQAKHTVRDQQWKALTSGLMSYVLEQGDRCASASSLELRHPFMDKRLIEFCLALPSEQKLSNGWTRMVMRRAMLLLPHDIRWRGGKANLTSNFTYGLLTHNSECIRQTMASKHSPVERFINKPVVQQSYKRLRNNQGVTGEDRLAIWQVSSLHLWLKKHAGSYQS
ncbi:MAG: lasso peptide isopeptide bond-forming cyclase [Cyanobacteria bacterium P01_F01_bin.150]